MSWASDNERLRFEAKTCPEPNSGCLLWTGAIRDGYGCFRSRGRGWVASRFAWGLANNAEPPKGLEVMHSCDTPSCVRPDHLRLGTHMDNMADRERKRRCNRTGERNGRAVLYEASVVEIRRRILAGEGDSRIARDYAIGRSAIRRIRAGHGWKHVELEEQLANGGNGR